MDLIYVDPAGEEKGVIQNFEVFDIVTSLSADPEEIDYQLQMKGLPFEIEHGGRIYIEGTEFGGRIERIETKGDIYISGKTWRGYLLMKVIEPPAGEAYLTVNGDAHDVMRQLIGGLAPLYMVEEGKSGIKVSGNIRYEYLASALNRLLKAAGARLCIRYVKDKVLVSAELIKDYSDEIEYSQDYGVEVISDDNRSKYNSIIAIGSGEGMERTVLKLWMLPNGQITDNKNHPDRPRGISERQYKYDYPNADNETIREDAEKKLLEIANTKTFELDITDLTQSVELGDIVGARDRRTGAYFKSDIYKKILRIDAIGTSITHEVRKEGE